MLRMSACHCGVLAAPLSTGRAKASLFSFPSSCRSLETAHSWGGWLGVHAPAPLAHLSRDLAVSGQVPQSRSPWLALWHLLYRLWSSGAAGVTPCLGYYL